MWPDLLQRCRTPEPQKVLPGVLGEVPARGGVLGRVLGKVLGKVLGRVLERVLESFNCIGLRGASKNIGLSGGRVCLGEGRLEVPNQVWEFRFLLSFPSFPRECRSSRNVWENA